MVVLAGAVALPAPALAIDLFGWKLFEREKAEPPPADAVFYIAELALTGGGEDLKTLLDGASDLVSRADEPPSGTTGLIARARGDRERLVAALYSKGFYGGTVDIRLAGHPLDAVTPDSRLAPGPDGKVAVAIRVDPGPEFRFGQTAIDAPTGDDTPPANPAAYDLVPGAPAESRLILAAEEKIVADWRDRGRPLARVVSRDVVADHKRHTLDVALNVEPGPLARFGRVAVSGTEEMDPDFVARMAAIPVGEPYAPDELIRAADRLRRLEVFDSIRIREGETLDADGTVPIEIEVSERKRRFVGAGVNWSSTDGAEVEAHWGHRNLFGHAERLRVEGRVSRIGDAPPEALDYSLSASFVKPGILDKDTDLTAEAGVAQEMPEAFERRSAMAKIGLTRRFTDALSGAIGAEIEHSRIKDEFGQRNFTLFGVPAELAYDSRDDRLNPTRGFRAVTFAEPMLDLTRQNSFFTVKGSFSAYQAIDEAKRFVLAGRVGAGSVVGAQNFTDVPADRRFYAGGGGSIRGYAYQNVGPKTAAGKPIGGLSYVEASAEMRIQVTESIGIVPFIDAGQVYFDEWPGNSDPLKIGVGLGLRYLTPIGPLRFDVAVPLDKGPDDPTVAFYLGLGQAF